MRRLLWRCLFLDSVCNYSTRVASVLRSLMGFAFVLCISHQLSVEATRHTTTETCRNRRRLLKTFGHTRSFIVKVEWKRIERRIPYRTGVNIVYVDDASRIPETDNHSAPWQVSDSHCHSPPHPPTFRPLSQTAIRHILSARQTAATKYFSTTTTTSNRLHFWHITHLHQTPMLCPKKRKALQTTEAFCKINLTLQPVAVGFL